jgi:hypothetical protein
MDDSIQGGAIPPVPTPVMGGGSALRIGSNPMPSVTILDSLKGCLFYVWKGWGTWKNSF